MTHAPRTGQVGKNSGLGAHPARTIGTQYAQDYITRFGFEADKHPAYSRASMARARR
ncbi:hypothetical protein ACTMU2_34535 [Cupriavidus basilensis]